MKIKTLLIAAAIAFSIPIAALAVNAPAINTPAQWTANSAASTITPNPSSLQVPCANIVGGCGGGGSSTVAGSNTQVQYNLNGVMAATSTFTVSSTGQVGVQNLETVLYADQFAGSDMDVKIQAAYNALPANGGEVMVPAGIFYSSSTIAITTAGKPLLLVCPAGGGFFYNGGTSLNFTPSNGATMFSYDVQNFVSAGTGIVNCNFTGPSGQGNVGSSVTTSSYAMKLGGTNGAFGFSLQNVHISGFGTGVYVGSNVSFLTIDKSVINKNGQNIYSPQVSGANGENMRVTNSTIADSNAATNIASSISQFCVDVQLSGNVQWTFENDSFDDCQVYSNQFGGTANIWNFTDDHFEDPNVITSNPYDYIQTQPSDAGGGATVINIKGGDMMQDLTSNAPKQFIEYGGSLTMDSLTLDVNNNVNTPMLHVAMPLNGNAIASWTGLQQKSYNTSASQAALYVVASTTFSMDGLQIGSSTATFSVSTSTFSIPFFATIYNFPTPAQLALGQCPMFAGVTDVGICTNDLYSVGSSTLNSIEINYPDGIYASSSWTTPIVFGDPTEKAIMQGIASKGTVLNYGGAAGTSAITLNYGILSAQIPHTMGQGLSKMNIECWNTTTTNPITGVFVGGANGAAGTVIDDTDIDGCGKGLVTASNTYNFTLSNSLIRNNGQNIDIKAAINAGESMRFLDDFIIDAANNNPSKCFNVEDFAASSLEIQGGSIDDCQLYLGQGILSAGLFGVHMENPGPAWGVYDFIYATSSAQTNLQIFGGAFVNDSASSSPEFITSGANISQTGITAFRNNTATTTAKFINTLAGAYSFTSNGFINSNSAVVNMFSNDSNTTNAQFVADSNGAYSFGIYQDGNNTTHFINGNADQGTLDLNGNWALHALVVSSTLSVKSTSTFTGVMEASGTQYYSLFASSTASTANTTVNWNLSNVQEVKLTTSTSLTFSNTNPGARYILMLLQDGTGSRTVTWPSTVQWAAGTAPTLTTAANKLDIATFVCAGVSSTDCYGGANLNYSP